MFEMNEAFKLVDGAHRETLFRDRTLASAAGSHFRSVDNQALFVMARDRLREEPTDQNVRAEYVLAVNRETSLAIGLYGMVKRDSRIGFEASNGYYYTPLDLVEKVINCQWVLDRLP